MRTRTSEKAFASLYGAIKEFLSAKNINEQDENEDVCLSSSSGESGRKELKPKTLVATSTANSAEEERGEKDITTPTTQLPPPDEVEGTESGAF